MFMEFMAVYQNSCITSLPLKRLHLQKQLKLLFSVPSSKWLQSSGKASICTSIAQENSAASVSEHGGIPLSGLEDSIAGYIFGKKKATEVAHLIWKKVIRKGDMVIDATCGNGYDTLAMLRLVADETRRGRVYAMDLQKVALESTSSLLDQHTTPDERELVELYAICHTKMEEIVPQGVTVRLVAFNLGYLPGGDKKIKTQSESTLQALEAAQKLLASGGLISLVVYVGHAGGREELEMVCSFASGLPPNNWSCCKLQMLNRPSAPVLVLLCKK